MIKRIFWISLGVAATAFVLSKAPKTLGRLVGSRSIAGSFMDSVTDFFADVKENMKAREVELLREIDEVE
ncbi:MAG: hypothetical protein LBR20_05380 [Propionibacteriaceae bacterium]|jgi:hypothetical protein|nr:hypothetical protein [Propionibacteriaceae bacterium]